jgi:hypothetical protein
VGGPLGCSVCVACNVVRFVFGVLWGRSPGLLNPPLTAAAFPLARAPGWVFPCGLMHMSCARLSPRGITCLSGCIHGCVLPIIPVLLPTGGLCFTACTNGGRPSCSSWVCWPASVSSTGTVVVCTRFLSVGSLSDALVPTTSHCRIPCLSGAAFGRLPTVALWVSWPVLLSVCVWRSSSPPPCVTHPFLSDLHLARCLSPGAPQLVFDLPVSYPGASRWFDEVSLCMALPCKAVS